MASTSPPLRILAITHSDAAEPCTFARVITPLRTLQATGKILFEHVRLVPWSIATFARTLRDLPNWDVIWLARPRHYLALPIITAAQQIGKPVLADVDDWLLGLPAGHDAAGWVGTPASKAIMRAALRTVDAVTVSTPVIAERCTVLGARTHVLPNAVDCERITRRPHRDDPLTIAFCGTASHRDDVLLVAPVLSYLLHTRPGRIRVVSVGCPIPPLQGQDGYTYYPPVPATAYPALLSSLDIDIGLAPLLDTPFNRAKSDIKYLEYSAAGAATLASPVAPYETSIRADCGIVVGANTPEDWSAALLRLVDDPLERHRLADNAYEWVHRERSIEATASSWYALFHSYAHDYAGRSARCARGRTQRITAQHVGRVLEHVVLRQAPYYGREVSSLLWHKVQSKARRLARGTSSPL